MRRSDRFRPRPAFRSSDFFRLGAMISMLVVLGLLIGRFRQPRALQGFEYDNSRTVHHAQGDRPAGGLAAAVTVAEQVPAAGAAAAPAAVPAATTASPPASPAKPAPNAAASPPPGVAADATEGTDLDPDEAQEAREDFEKITDGTLQMQPEEMKAYWRLVQWVKRQPEAALRKRARSDIFYTQFMQWPSKYRGQLFETDLQIRRAWEHDPTRQYDGKIYELWGISQESRSRFYAVVSPDVPEGFPLGPDVDVSVRVVGYFLKLQGYIPAAAKPGDRPELAPLLVGRVIWSALATAPGPWPPTGCGW